MKRFTVSKEWIEYAHGPGAESGYAMATELCELPVNKDGSVTIPRRSLIEEIQDVAELYLGNTTVQEDERLWFRLYPFKLVARCKKFLTEQPS